MRARRDRRHRRAEPVRDGLPRREDDGRPPAGQAGGEARRHRRRHRHAGEPRHAGRCKELLNPPDRRSTCSEPTSRVVLELAASRKRFGATVALDGVDLDAAPRRGARAHRRERRGQEHADERPRRRARARRAARCARRRGRTRPASPLEARAPRHRAHPPGAVALPAPHGGGEHPARRSSRRARGWLDRARERAARARAVLERFDHPEIHPDRACADLPLAARQVVEICRALAARRARRADGRADEQPASARTSSASSRSSGGCARAASRVVYISHFLEEVREIADRFTVLRDGRSVATGRARRRDANEQLIAQMVGRSVERALPGRAAPAPARRGRCSRCADLARRRARAGVASSCAAARSSASPGWSARAAPSWCARSSASTRPRAATVARRAAARAGARRAPAHAARAQGVGYLSEDRKGEGLALAAARSPTTSRCTRLRRCAARRAGSTSRGSASRPRSGSRALGVQGALAAAAGRARSRAATSRRSRSARLLHQDADVLLLDEPTRGHRHRQQGADLRGHRATGAGSGKARADGQLVPARAVRPLRPPGGDVPRAALARRARSAEWTPGVA